MIELFQLLAALVGMPPPPPRPPVGQERGGPLDRLLREDDAALLRARSPPVATRPVRLW